MGKDELGMGRGRISRVNAVSLKAVKSRCDGIDGTTHVLDRSIRKGSKVERELQEWDGITNEVGGRG